MSLGIKVLWKDVRNQDIHPLDHYKKYYVDASKSEIIKADRLFYILLSIEKHLDHLFPKEDNKSLQDSLESKIKPVFVPSTDFSKFEFSKDIETYLEKKHKGKNRLEVFTDDRTFYKFLVLKQKTKLIPIVKTDKNIPRDFGEDPLQYKKLHYKDATVEELYTLDKNLHDVLKRKGDLIKLPRLKIRYADIGPDPLEFYHKNFDGKTKGQLMLICDPLYRKLKKDKKIDQIPAHEYENDPLGYLQERYPGLTESQLSRKNLNLLRYLQKYDLLNIDLVPNS